MNTIEARAFLALYDDLVDAYNCLNHERFTAEITRRCAEFNRNHPGFSELLVAMQLHFGNRGK